MWIHRTLLVKEFHVPASLIDRQSMQHLKPHGERGWCFLPHSLCSMPGELCRRAKLQIRTTNRATVPQTSRDLCKLIVQTPWPDRGCGENNLGTAAAEGVQYRLCWDGLAHVSIELWRARINSKSSAHGWSGWQFPRTALLCRGNEIRTRNVEMAAWPQFIKLPIPSRSNTYTRSATHHDEASKYHQNYFRSRSWLEGRQAIADSGSPRTASGFNAPKCACPRMVISEATARHPSVAWAAVAFGELQIINGTISLSDLAGTSV
ncbi:hypothetical protein C8R45DRAFT_1082792 [Mycena sanguinolenta]|nr:hypothetical protein C8R45DRAFT_1082792 [Mycena sanguinolenta]